jgi:Amt family ammonium transporter
MLGWLTVERIRDGGPRPFGAASGVVAGLVAITPSSGTVDTLGVSAEYRKLTAWRRRINWT